MLRTQRPPYGPRMNSLVGGNILGRGLTINDLLVTYYLRQARMSQMDTVLQHARMYGYRETFMAYTRVYLPRQLAVLFQEIHQAEQSLRDICQRQQGGETVPVRIARGFARLGRAPWKEAPFASMLTILARCRRYIRLTIR